MNLKSKVHNPSFHKGFFLCLFLFGLALRILWSADMEWKYDEKWMFEHSQEIAQSGNFPLIGMKSGGGIVNPALGAWIFALFSKFADTPLGLLHFVQGTNIVSLVGFLLFAFLGLRKDPEQKVWFWGITLASVSPLAILFSRKIWAQDILPLFCLLVIVSHFYKSRPWGALSWGLFGALIGQIHMSGFFYAFGLFVFTMLWDYLNNHKTRWLYWFLGSVLGTIPLLPWLIHILQHPSNSTSLAIKNLLRFRFYTYWILDALGIHMKYSFHDAFWEFIKMPTFSSFPTYGVGLLHAFLLLIGLWALYRSLKFVFNLRSRVKNLKFLKETNTTTFYLFALLIGVGVPFSLSGITIHPHYLIVAFPFPYIWLSKVIHPRKNLFLAVTISQALISLAFLTFVHMKGGVEAGDYGKSYRLNREEVFPKSH